MIRGDEYKLIEYPEAGRMQLFHLPSDPWELENLAEIRSRKPSSQSY